MISFRRFTDIGILYGRFIPILPDSDLLRLDACAKEAVERHFNIGNARGGKNRCAHKFCGVARIPALNEAFQRTCNTEQYRMHSDCNTEVSTCMILYIIEIQLPLLCNWVCTTVWLWYDYYARLAVSGFC